MSKSTVQRIVAIACLLGLVASMAPDVANAQEKTVDWYRLLEGFAPPPAEAGRNIPSWGVGEEGGPPVAWLTDGIQMNDVGFSRNGSVVVTVEGKVPDAGGQPAGPWNILLTGPRAGVERVYLSPPGELPAVPDVEGDLREAGVPFEATNCLEYNSPSFGSKMWRLSPEGRQPFWIVQEWSCGSTGCMTTFKSYYLEPHPDELSRMAAACG